MSNLKNDNELTPTKCELGVLQKLTSNLFKAKSPDSILENAKSSNLKKTLGALDLIILGVGAIIGTGIFTIVGIATVGGPESAGAGPALVISMILASIACIFSALCYSEFAAMIPVAGSAYLYTYATMGELFAFVIGWVLILEYFMGTVTVAIAWSGYLFQFLEGFKAHLPAFVTNQSLWIINIPTTLPITINIPAILILLATGAILVKGIKESTKTAGIMVAIKLAVIILFIIAGTFYVKPENWSPFAPNGFEGIFMGAFIIFFAYVGFDAIATAAEETKNPQRDLPIGIIGSLIICTIVYVLVALVLTGVVPYESIDIKAPIAHAMHYVGKDWIAGLISIGALAGLTSVLMVMMLAGTRIIYAMSRDNFLPPYLKKIHPKLGTPHVVTILSVIICVLGSMFLNLNIAAELCNFGTFASFIIVCITVLILRKTDPDRERPFKVPFCPWFPILGILCSGGLSIYSMKFLTTSRVVFPLWIVIGILIYFTYSYGQHRKAEDEQQIKTNKEKSI